MYFFSNRLWGEKTARFSCFLFVSSLVFVYLSRTPMYDWPTAIFYFSYCGFYILYCQDSNKKRYFALAIMSIVLASLSRFSISLGLAGIHLILVNWISKRRFSRWIADGLILIVFVFFGNLPWILGQITTHGNVFWDTFLYDNIGRYIREPGNARLHRDYYGFLIYTLIGVLPHTFGVIASFFQKDFFKRLRSPLDLSLLAAYLPGLVIFSFSGHVKLARYIAYVFPPLLMHLGYHWITHDLFQPKWRMLCGRATLGTLGGLIAIFALLIWQFPNEVRESWLLAGGIIGLLLSLLYLSWYGIRFQYDAISKNGHIWIWGYAVIYILFFSILSIEYQRASFLTSVRDSI